MGGVNRHSETGNLGKKKILEIRQPVLKNNSPGKVFNELGSKSARSSYCAHCAVLAKPTIHSRPSLLAGCNQRSFLCLALCDVDLLPNFSFPTHEISNLCFAPESTNQRRVSFLVYHLSSFGAYFTPLTLTLFVF